MITIVYLVMKSQTVGEDAVDYYDTRTEQLFFLLTRMGKK